MIDYTQPAELIEPHSYLHVAFQDMAADFCSSGETRYKDYISTSLAQFSAYVAQLHKYAAGQDLATGHVPQSTYWLVAEDDILVGTASIRHRLNEQLSHEGGHIGYNIRPSYRGRGLGTLQLHLVLAKASGLGLLQVLITCDTDNIASSKIIEKNDGVLDNRVVSRTSGKQVSRYWVDLSH